MGATYSGESLAAAVQDGSLEDRSLRSALEITGMVKASDQPDHIQFARGGCDSWLELPTGAIAEAEHLGQRPCGDHVHPVVKIRLVEPEDSYAQVLASLLATPLSTV